MQVIGQGMNKQRGGTLVGLIIGVLVGLGVALAVAVYITKVPVPFMNKTPSRNSDSDAAEARKNKDWNPNAPLAGKNPARAPSASGEVIPVPAPDSAAEGPLVVPDSVIVKPARSAASATVPAPAIAAARPAARPTPSADPLGDLAKARSEASSADPFNYFVQAGAFRTPEDAEQQRARLLLMGVQARVSEREQAGRTVYRVRVGPFVKKDEADRIKERLDNNSVETALVRVQR